MLLMKPVSEFQMSMPVITCSDVLYKLVYFEETLLEVYYQDRLLMLWSDNRNVNKQFLFASTAISVEFASDEESDSLTGLILAYELLYHKP